MENKKLEDVPARMSIFVDTNILIYHLLEDELYGESCREFLKRVEEKDVIAFISPVVASETLFLYLRFWIIQNKKVAPKKVLEYLKKNRSVIKEVNFQKPQKLFVVAGAPRQDAAPAGFEAWRYPSFPYSVISSDLSSSSNPCPGNHRFILAAFPIQFSPFCHPSHIVSKLNQDVAFEH